MFAEEVAEGGEELVARVDLKGESEGAFLAVIFEDEDDFLEAGVEIAEAFDFGEGRGIIGVGDEDPEALVPLRWWSATSSRSTPDAVISRTAPPEALGGTARAGFGSAAGGGGEFFASRLVIVEFFVGDKIDRFGDDFDVGGEVAGFVGGIDPASHFDDLILF